MSSRTANTNPRSIGGSSLLVLTLLTAASCGGGSSEVGTVFVSAAASLTDAFTEIETAFEQTQPDVDVLLNLGGSSTLREQILEGAPADVFASANTSNLDQVIDGVDDAGAPVIFAHNLLQIAVPPGNPAGVTGLGDFDEEDLLIGLCAEPVPCGVFAREALHNAGIVPAVDTNEPDVRALLTKIAAGELDAGITYVTDVAATEGSAEGVDIPEQQNVIAEYPVAVVSQNPNAVLFVDFVLSDEGQSILREYGFIAP